MPLSDAILKTTSVDTGLDVNKHIQTIREKQELYKEQDALLSKRLEGLDVDKKQDAQLGAQFVDMRRRIKLHMVANPLEVSEATIALVGAEKLRQHFANQFVSLSPDDRKMWLINFAFVITPSLRNFINKVQKLAQFTSLGQGRNLLVGGPSGSGKTTVLNWMAYCLMPQVGPEHNIVPIIKIDAPVSNRSSKPLLQRMVLALGKGFSENDKEEFLLDKIRVLLALCKTELMVVDEIEHVTVESIKRSILEVSNLNPGIPIICASCEPHNWLGNDPEITGRWNDRFDLERFNGERLLGLLAHLELLLPFSQPSHLYLHEIQVPDGKRRSSTVDGPARLIEAWTGGILRDIMALIVDASMKAIDRGSPRLTAEILQEAWSEIQYAPVRDVFDNVYQSNT